MGWSDSDNRASLSSTCTLLPTGTELGNIDGKYLRKHNPGYSRYSTLYLGASRMKSKLVSGADKMIFGCIPGIRVDILYLTVYLGKPDDNSPLSVK